MEWIGGCIYSKISHSCTCSRFSYHEDHSDFCRYPALVSHHPSRLIASCLTRIIHNEYNSYLFMYHKASTIFFYISQTRYKIVTLDLTWQENSLTLYFVEVWRKCRIAHLLTKTHSSWSQADRTCLLSSGSQILQNSLSGRFTHVLRQHNNHNADFNFWLTSAPLVVRQINGKLLHGDRCKSYHCENTLNSNLSTRNALKVDWLWVMIM